MKPIHSQEIDTVYKLLKSSKDGLTFKEAEKRNARYGKNELPKEKPLGKAFIFFSQINNILIYILIGAGIISFFLKDFIDASIIFLSVLISTVIGYIQEKKANDALSKLKNLVEHTSFVLRDKKEIEIDSTLLTTGDIIFIHSGSRIPADGRLIEAINLAVNESSLTGESLPSEKSPEPILEGASLADRENMVYAGTVAIRGSGRVLVTAVGQDTELGKISTLVSQTVEQKTPLQHRLEEFSRQVGLYIGALSVLLIFFGVIQGRSFFEMFLTGVALMVAAIPEGLTVAVTVILTIGMQQILKRKALIRKLIAAETLGSTTVICTDKTGTLTEGKMHVAHIVIGENEYEFGSIGTRQNKEEAKLVSFCLQAAMMCNDALIENPKDELSRWRVIGESTDAALLSAAVQSGLNKDKLLKKQPRVDELPFDSNLKYMISLHKDTEKFILYEKGAPEIILEKSKYFYHKGKLIKLSASDRKKLKNNYTKLTNKGLRVIAVAHKNIKELEWSKGDKWEAIDRELTLLGFIALKDPLRPEAKDTILQCRQAGIRPVIITGDYHLTAKAIANELGLLVSDDRIMLGSDLDKISDEKLKFLSGKIDIYARVSPHHKLRIVKSLKSRGEVVAMTGDGINDSPALKAADIGISLGTATDIAKETSDLVLLDSNFSTIVNSVWQGRVIFNNIRKVITFLLSDTFSQIILISGSILFGFPLALLPAQILWTNIIQDGFPGFALAMEKGGSGVMKDKPIKRKDPILTREMKAIIFIVGVMRDIFILTLFVYLLKANYPINIVRTFVFAAVGLNSLVNIYSLRNLKKPIWASNPFSNKYLNIAVLASLVLLIAGVYAPLMQKFLSTADLSLNLWLVIAVIGACSLASIEMVKYLTLRRERLN